MSAKSVFSASVFSLVVGVTWLVSPVATSHEADEARPALSIYKLRYTDAGSIAKSLTDLLRGGNDIRISADSQQNSLIVLGPKEVQDAVMALLKLVDRRNTSGNCEASAERSVPTPSEEQSENMSDAEMRKFVFALSRHVRDLEHRVSQLEKDRSFRIIPIPAPK